MVGLATPELKLDALDLSYGWYFLCNNGCLYYNSLENSIPYAEGIQNGSEIEVLLNSDRTISFTIDGENKGVAISSLPMEDLYPAVYLFSPYASVELLY